MFNAERLLGSLLSNALGQGLTGRVCERVAAMAAA